MANVLITGVSGTVGPVVARKLLAQGHSVTGLSRREPAPEKTVAGVNYVQGDFSSAEALKALDGLKFDCLVHFVSLPIPKEPDAVVQFLSSNVAGHCYLFNYLLDRGCSKFIVASSIGACGCLDAGFIPEKLPIPADHPTHSRSHYSFSKALLEDICRYYCRKNADIDMIVFRFGGIYDHAIHTPNGDVSTDRPFCTYGVVDLEDVANATVAAVKAQKNPGYHQYNIVGPDAASREPVIDVLKQIFSEEVLSKWDLSPYMAPGGEYLPLYDIAPLEKELGFIPEYNSQQYIKKEL